MSIRNEFEYLFLTAKVMTLAPIIWIFCFYLPGLSNPTGYLLVVSLAMIAMSAIAAYLWWICSVIINVATHGYESFGRTLLAMVCSIVTALLMCGLLMLQYFQQNFMRSLGIFFVDNSLVWFSLAVILLLFIIVAYSRQMSR